MPSLDRTATESYGNTVAENARKPRKPQVKTLLQKGGILDSGNVPYMNESRRA